jgi:flavin reductase (DIM6/NTAB) family NADH-FMN oxidoreductase RutF
MFYEPGKTSHNLPHDPFKSCVVPRPIGWISTLSATGVPNLAPYSQFQNLTFDPPATLRLPGNSSVGTVDVAIGRVVGIHIAESALTADGRVDVLRLRPIARLGYYDYTSIESVFQMIIPGNDPAVLAGLEGRPFRE